MHYARLFLSTIEIRCKEMDECKDCGTKIDLLEAADGSFCICESCVAQEMEMNK